MINKTRKPKLSPIQTTYLEFELLGACPLVGDFIESNFPNSYEDWLDNAIDKAGYDVIFWEYNHICILLILESNGAFLE